MPVDVGILTYTLKVFLDEFLNGYSRIHGHAVMLLHLLGLIDLGLALIFALWSREGSFEGLAAKALTYGFWALIVAQWITLAPKVINGFVFLGLTAGGSTMTVQEFTNPSEIARLGLVATEPLWNHIRGYGWAAFLHLLDITVCGFLGLLILGGFFVIAIEAFVFYLQFYIFAVLATVLVPFGINRYTSWITDGALSTMVAHGIKVMVLAFLTSVMFPVLQHFMITKAPTWGHLFAMTLGIGAMAMLCVTLPSRAVAMFTHGPQLTAGVFAATLIGGKMLLGNFGGWHRTPMQTSNMPPQRTNTPGPRHEGQRPATP